MSIVYLKANVTNKVLEFEKQKRSFASKILIRYGNDEKTDVHVEDFSLDITLGDSWNENYSYNDKGLFLIENERIVLPPKGSVVVSIRESIRMPNNKFGIVLSTGSLFLQEGVQIPSAKVEPGYSGILKLRLVNSSNKKVFLNKNQKIASIIFFDTSHTPHLIEATNSENTNIPKQGKWNKVRSWFKQQGVGQAIQLTIAIATSLSMLIGAIAFAYGVYKDHHTAPQNTPTQTSR